MGRSRSNVRWAVLLAPLGVGLILILATCTKAAPAGQMLLLPTRSTDVTGSAMPSGGSSNLASTPPKSSFATPTRLPGETQAPPTPDKPRPLPTLRSQPQAYLVKAGDALGKIATSFNVSIDELIKANSLTNPDHLEVGQQLTIPAPTPQAPGSGFKIIPDAELVNSPSSVGFDPLSFVQKRGGYLSQFQGDADGVTLTGAQIVANVARDYSVNPRLLLAVLDYQSNWVTSSNPDPKYNDYPVGLIDSTRAGLYKQLSWAANNLNRGFYVWQVRGVGNWILADGSVVPVNPSINAGTAGVQELMALLYNRSGWDKAVSDLGVYAAYKELFGYPFDYSVEPLLPANLAQPALQLPFEPGVAWFFTGGPHGGWGDGSAWAAVDFGPPDDQTGCFISTAWVTATAPGLIVRSDQGAVVQNLQGINNEQTGWTVLYLHIASLDRVPPGTIVLAGDRIGHASCEGGVAFATHMHLARRYNGVWISTDRLPDPAIPGSLPFNLEGWSSQGTGNEYDGLLTRNGTQIEAYDGRSPANQIQR